MTRRAKIQEIQPGLVAALVALIDKVDSGRFSRRIDSSVNNLKFDPNGVDETRRKFFGTLYNTYSFFALYANVDGSDAEATQVPFEKRP